MQPPIPSPHGDSATPMLASSRFQLGGYLLVLVMGLMCCGIGGLEAMLSVSSIRSGPSLLSPIQEVVLWLGAGFLLTGVGIWGIVQWRKQAKVQ